ncbi:MAG: class I SAM-dependent methyltransferase [Thermoleophilaceae bacterium]|nr:class I SAM-dependent methyltransferase [Thermoleophilaceae bacterium]
MSDAAVWHDVECGSYAADLPLWRELAKRAGGPVLELGAGTGRVALDLAAHGHGVTAVERDRELLDELARRAQARGLEVERVADDARNLTLSTRFALVVAPMQFLQIVGGPAGRSAVIGAAAASLAVGDHFAAALVEVDESVAPDDAAPPVPDVGEHDGWVYSSLPLDVRPEPGGVAVERLRQRVSPAGRLEEERHTQLLDSLTVDQLEYEAAERGLRAVERREVPATADHVGSMVVVCRR